MKKFNKKLHLFHLQRYKKGIKNSLDYPQK